MFLDEKRSPFAPHFFIGPKSCQSGQGQKNKPPGSLRILRVTSLQARPTIRSDSTREFPHPESDVVAVGWPAGPTIRSDSTREFPHPESDVVAVGGAACSTNRSNVRNGRQLHQRAKPRTSPGSHPRSHQSAQSPHSKEIRRTCGLSRAGAVGCLTGPAQPIETIGFGFVVVLEKERFSALLLGMNPWLRSSASRSGEADVASIGGAGCSTYRLFVAYEKTGTSTPIT
ncbi:hypothetical protein SCOR_07980 [Sulfidibacter corallicola]